MKKHLSLTNKSIPWNEIKPYLENYRKKFQQEFPFRSVPVNEIQDKIKECLITNTPYKD